MQEKLSKETWELLEDSHDHSSLEELLAKGPGLRERLLRELRQAGYEPGDYVALSDEYR